MRGLRNLTELLKGATSHFVCVLKIYHKCFCVHHSQFILVFSNFDKSCSLLVYRRDLPTPDKGLFNSFNQTAPTNLLSLPPKILIGLQL